MNILSYLHVQAVHAAGVVQIPRNVDGFEDPNALVTQGCAAAQWVFAGAILFSVLFALIAAFEYMRSSGDPAKVKTATNRLIFVAIGVAVALIAFLFPTIIASLLQAGTVKAC